MDFDTFMTIVCFVTAGICYVGYKLPSKNVYKRPKKYRVEYWIERTGGFR